MALYAFDGTWNIRDGKQAIDHVQEPQFGPDQAARRDTAETNVHRFREFYGVKRSEYLQGVGTRYGRLGRAVGGAFGAGGRHRIREMYYRLIERYFDSSNPDQDIDIVGFSRGAALAVHFANLLATHGLRDPSNKRHLAFKYFPELGWTWRHPKKGLDDVKKPTVRFLGLWDCVATFGWPIRPFRNRAKKWKIWKIPNNVTHSFHAMALDEVRATFALVRPQGPAKRKPPHYEVWFRGVHSNIGGGYVDRGLSDIALAWMMEQAIWTWRKVGWTIPETFEKAVRALEPQNGPLPSWTGSKLETLEPDPDGSIGRPANLKRQAWRKLSEEPLVHHSVFLRDKNLVSDHYGGNRPRLRRIPANARQVFDPPLFYIDTRLEAARSLALEAFSRVPVRPQDWLRQDDHYIFRSDHWVALGTAEGRDADPKWQVSRDVFLQIAFDWLLTGRPGTADEFEVSGALTDLDGHPLETVSEINEVQRCVVAALSKIKPYLPWRAELGSR